MIRDRKYLNFLHTQPCLFCGELGEGNCGHHLKACKSGGVGLKAPDNHTVPICWVCHLELHNHGEKTFLKKWGMEMNQFEARELTENLYNKYKECKNG